MFWGFTSITPKGLVTIKTRWAVRAANVVLGVHIKSPWRQKSSSWWFKVTFLGWLIDPFNGESWPPTFGDQKVTAFSSPGSGWRIIICLVVLDIFYFHPYLGKWYKVSNLTHIFQGGWNHQLVIIWARWMIKILNVHLILGSNCWLPVFWHSFQNQALNSYYDYILTTDEHKQLICSRESPVELFRKVRAAWDVWKCMSNVNMHEKFI